MFLHLAVPCSLQLDVESNEFDLVMVAKWEINRLETDLEQELGVHAVMDE